MTRLIVDDAGKRRAFQLREGRLTIGTRADATLRLQAEGVAEVHAELELAGGELRLRPRPGVMPPRVGGVPAEGETLLAPGAVVQIGGATLSVVADEAPVPAPAPAPARARSDSAPGRSRARRATPSARRSRAAATAGRAGRTPRVTRRSRGLPGWALALILLAVAGLAAVLVPKLLTTAPPSDLGPKASLRVAREALAEGNLPQARERVDGIRPEDLDEATRAEFVAVRADLEEAEAANQLALENMRGTEYLNTQLKNFETNYLRGEARRSQARVFLKRCREFQQRWPRHPELGWVERMQERFTPIAELDSPPTYEDIAFEAKTLTWANPRDYETAFALVRRFAEEQASPDDRAQALALIDDMTVQRREWFDDRMQQARWEYGRGQEGKSVAWLVMLILYSGDPDMADQAAGELIKFEGLPGWLEAYQRDKPEKYAKLERNPVIAGYIREHDLE